MRRTSRGFRPVVVVALEVVAPSSLTPSAVERMHVLKESIIVQRPTSRFGGKGKGKRPPAHCSSSPRSGQAAPPCLAGMITLLTLFLVLVLLLQSPQAPHLRTLQSTGNPHFSKEENQEARWEPGHFSPLQGVVCSRGGQGAPPGSASLMTFLVLVVVP